MSSVYPPAAKYFNKLHSFLIWIRCSASINKIIHIGDMLITTWNPTMRRANIVGINISCLNYIDLLFFSSLNFIICTVFIVFHSHWIELTLTLLCTYFLLQLKERKKPILVSEKKGCHLCHNTFSEPDVVCLPGGVPVHTHCVAQRVRDPPTKRQLTNSSNHTWDLTPFKLQFDLWPGGTEIKQDCVEDCGDDEKKAQNTRLPE